MIMNYEKNIKCTYYHRMEADSEFINSDCYNKEGLNLTDYTLSNKAETRLWSAALVVELWRLRLLGRLLFGEDH